MYKRILSFIIICFFLLALSGCDEDWYPMHTEESYDFFPIEANAEDTSSFFAEIETFASTFEEELILGSIILTYDQNSNYKVDFRFSKSMSEHMAVRVRCTYDSIKKGIEYSEYFVGHRKVHTPFEKSVDYTKWNMNFEDGMQILKEKMAEKDIEIFDRIVCRCYESKWVCRIFISEQIAYPDEIVIAVSS